MIHPARRERKKSEGTDVASTQFFLRWRMRLGNHPPPFFVKGRVACTREVSYVGAVLAEATNSICPISKRVILCVDDEPMILQYETALLEMSGYAVLGASSGEDALRLVTTCAIDAVILEYGMRGMSGHEIALEIGRVRPRLAIILVSGSDVPTDVLALVDAFVVKVEAWQKLLPTLAEICSRISPSGTPAQESPTREASD
jgi:CheY-like chemotaxis protein